MQEKFRLGGNKTTQQLHRKDFERYQPLRSMGTISSKTSSVERDHKDLALLLESAKFGKWEIVWDIYNEKAVYGKLLS